VDELKAGFEPVLKSARCCLLKRKENLTRQAEVPPARPAALQPQNRPCLSYRLKEDFQQLWDYDSATWAGKFLDEWCRPAMRFRIEPMKKIARTLRKHRYPILNYFRTQEEFSSYS